ncbi:hypothetical protein SAR03_22750 [Staphylococcus arlettae]|uniref:Secreted protein n=1 Tax=Staphylococcus arlettae TaxID=29378 RepID=A0ABQ0XZT6_9STAP|nr:hypothetical protein SAR03_22750 [Staphylococcus arlettae]
MYFFDFIRVPLPAASTIACLCMSANPPLKYTLHNYYNLTLVTVSRLKPSIMYKDNNKYTELHCKKA